MTTTRTKRIAPILLTAAGCLVVGSTGGAVAGGFLDGADIKNGSLTGKDLKNHSIKAKDIDAGTLGSLEGPAGTPGTNGTNGVSGLQLLEASQAYTGGSGPADFGLSCPAGKSVLGVAGYWQGSSAAVQAVFDGVPSGGLVFTEGLPVNDTLWIQITCANAPGAAVAAQAARHKS